MGELLLPRVGGEAVLRKVAGGVVPHKDGAAAGPEHAPELLYRLQACVTSARGGLLFPRAPTTTHTELRAVHFGSPQ